jgi:hypothetical protein
MAMEKERVTYRNSLNVDLYVRRGRGELAMVSMPGTMSEKFLFTVRDDAVAQKINANLGKKVALRL